MSDRIETLETAVRIHGKQITSLHNMVAKLVGLVIATNPESRDKVRALLGDLMRDLGARGEAQNGESS